MLLKLNDILANADSSGIDLNNYLKKIVKNGVVDVMKAKFKGLEADDIEVLDTLLDLTKKLLPYEIIPILSKAGVPGLR